MMYDFLNGSEEVKASENLKKRVHGYIVKNKIMTAVKSVSVCAAAFLMCFSIGVNVSPNMALAMRDVPVIGKIVRAVTFDKYEQKIGGSEAKIVTPKIEGLADEKVMNEINNAIAEDAKKLIEEFEAEAEILKEQFGDDVHMGVESDYTIRTDTEDYYAIDIYFFNVVGSSSTTHKFYTVDRKTGEIVSLDDFIKTDGAREKVNDLIKAEMMRRNEKEDGAYWVEDDEYTEGFKGIKENQNFFINEDGNLVICFDKYEVAAGYMGCPEFVIDMKSVK